MPERVLHPILYHTNTELKQFLMNIIGILNGQLTLSNNMQSIFQIMQTLLSILCLKFWFLSLPLFPVLLGYAQMSNHLIFYKLLEGNVQWGSPVDLAGHLLNPIFYSNNLEPFHERENRQCTHCYESESCWNTAFCEKCRASDRASMYSIW